METHQIVEELKALIIEKSLPRTAVAIFGIKCPYCGKSDRIHRLETPEDLPADIDPEATSRYADLWQRLNPSMARLGVCKFCLNPLELILRKGYAKGLDHQ
ncbi:MAG: hypothetical protein WAM73_07340 [Desulfobacterales bacterium]